MIRKSGHRFPAFAKPASAGEQPMPWLGITLL